MSDDRRAIEAQRRLDLAGAGGREGSNDPARDPYAAGWLNQFSLTLNGPHIESGIIVDAVPGAYCYRVVSGRQGYVYCSPGGADAAFGPAGVKSTHTFPPLSRVYFVRHPETPDIGTIICAEPHWSVHTGNQPADAIWPFVRTGTAVEASHRYAFEASAYTAATGPVNLEGVEGADLSAGRPFDATTVGEWGKQTETGLGLFLDPFQIYLRVDESTGVFGFYDDSLLRVAGHNFQLLTSQLEVEHLDDEGELVGVERGCLYPWEPHGLWRYNQVTPNWSSSAVSNHGLAAGQGDRLLDPLQVQAGNGFAVREPEVLGQLSAARFYNWTGYLGQAGHRVVAAPVQLDWAYPSVPVGAKTALVTAVDQFPSGRLAVDGNPGPTAQPYAVPVNAYGGPDQPGLFEEHRGLDGRVTQRSARGFLFAKRPSIPTPRPIRQAADPDGDGPDSGYNASGLAGNTAAHRIKSDPTPTTDPGRRACMLPDAVAYLFNWAALHPFAYHERDWVVAQEGATGTGLVNQRIPDYGSLSAAAYLAAPTPAFMDIDHRYGSTAAVYENESIFSMSEDGSIVIRDGWGSEIIMGGGKIKFRAAADIEIHSGRDVQVWAGYDLVLKAHNSVDVSAANGDLRTKAEGNSHHVAGNSGFGGFLFESQAVCAVNDYSEHGQSTISSGFVVRCLSSTVDVVGADIRLSLDDAAPTDARIYLDAGTSRSVFTRAKRHVAKVNANGSIVQLFNNGAGAVHSANEFCDGYAMIGTPLNVKGKAFLGDCLSVTGWVTSMEHFASANAKTMKGTVSQFNSDFDETEGDVNDRLTYLSTTYATAFDAQVIPAPGVTDAEFGFRTVDDYGSASSYVYWRSHWEALADADGQTLTAWNEPVVTGLVSGDESRPFPGTRWTAGGGYAYQTSVFVDLTDGTAIDRDANRGVYETGSPPSATTGTLADLYVVTVPVP